MLSPPTNEEVAAILRSSPEHLKRALLISFYCGLRPGNAELFGLTHEAVSFERNCITVTSARKGGLIKRDVPLHPVLRGYLKEWKKDGHSWLIHYRGKPVRSIKRAYLNAKQKAGIARRLRLYDFRHAFATFLLATGADIKAVSELLGHKNPEVTRRVYQHVVDAQKRNAIETLPELDVDSDTIGTNGTTISKNGA